jgi:hypothetical protein
MSFSENRGQKGKTVLEAGTSGRGEDVRKECRRADMVEISCTHV